MSDPLRFTIPGPPVAKGRPRVALRGGKVHGYTPAKTTSYEGAVRMAFTAAYPGFIPVDGPVSLYVTAYFMPPKCLKPQPGVDLEAVRHTKPPDADNVAKAISDALNGVAWRDDKQVSDLTVRKRYSPTPCVEVNIIAAPVID